MIADDSSVNLVANSTFAYPETLIIFESDEQASYFVEHFNIRLHNDYKQGMMEGEYFFNVVHNAGVKKDKYYADCMLKSSEKEALERRDELEVAALESQSPE